jgi:hypothetical protein
MFGMLSRSILRIIHTLRLLHFPLCSTTVDSATARKLAAAAGMLRLSPKAPPMPGMDLNDGKPHLIDAPVTGAVTGSWASDRMRGSC